MSYQPPGPTAHQMLQEVREAHAEVRRCIEQMDELTSKQHFDAMELTAARFRISRASMIRRASSIRASQDLLRRATPEESAAIGRVREAAREMMRKSADHVTCWTAERIEMDWAGYCKASRAIRRDMLREIAEEERLLLPIIEKRRFDSPVESAKAA